jgi:hypothetical protein
MSVYYEKDTVHDKVVKNSENFHLHLTIEYPAAQFLTNNYMDQFMQFVRWIQAFYFLKDFLEKDEENLIPTMMFIDESVSY